MKKSLILLALKFKENNKIPFLNLNKLAKIEKKAVTSFVKGTRKQDFHLWSEGKLVEFFKTVTCILFQWL